MFPSNACAVSILSNTVLGFKVMDYIPDVSTGAAPPDSNPRAYTATTVSVSPAASALM